MQSSEHRCTPSSLTVIGLGYIGLPTAVAFAHAGWGVWGIDVSRERVNLINQGKLPFREDGLEELLAEAVEASKLRASTEPVAADVYIIAVPTPFTEERAADLSYIHAASDAIAPILKAGDLVILESTVPPGTTQGMAERIQAARPDIASELMFAHSPERVLPGRIVEEIIANDRIIGGITPQAAAHAKAIYATFCKGEISVTDASTAELSKLVENSYRDVNIAFANEVSVICENLGINVWELIELANRHPRVNILNPGPGVGGHCIAVDPWFIVAAAPEESRLIRTAREINDVKPRRVITQVSRTIDRLPHSSQVALLGIAFKPDIDDLRASPALDIASELARTHPDTSFAVVEPNINTLPTQLSRLSNVKLVDTETAIADSEILVVLVDHTPFKAISPDLLADKTVIDTRGMWRS